MARSRPGKINDGTADTAAPVVLPGGAKTPVRTNPLAENQRGAWFDGPDAITGLRELDGALEFDLPRDTGRFTMGASRSCDIALPGRGLSATHCLLERRGTQIRLIDQASTNGTYFQDRKIDDVKIAPGDTFTLAPVTFLAMNDEMRAHGPTIVRRWI